ncbi:DUF2336 domain-containing protein [Hyphococcus sp.]|uniref:DUF2336 domain-containing protein n=1 Tax=Hyphococcus sp. TaxID=2038636 RepID=UPI0035C77EA0
MTASASRLNQLLELARAGSPETRGKLLHALAELLLTESDRISATAQQHLDAILTQLSGEAAPALKRDLARRFADAQRAPKGLLKALARDDISIADPILRRSTVLSQEDLLALIHSQGEQHLAAIARRREIAPEIAGALADRGGEETLLILARNQGAVFSFSGMGAMTAKARAFPALQAPMTERYDLPPLFLTQLYFHVPSALKKAILKRSDMLDPTLVEQAVKANRRNVFDEASQTAEKMDADDANAVALRVIAEKIENNAVDEALLRTLIAEKYDAAFPFAFAHLAGVDLATARIIMEDRTFEALAIACRASNLAQQTFAKMVFFFRKGNGDEARALKILDVYVKVPTDAAERVMRFWRMRTEAAASAARLSRFIEDSDDDPLTLTTRAKGW